MITRIELEHFMSHRKTVIEPAKGLTVLVGPNNCGKSAVVSALQIVCENAPGDYMVRHKENECMVAVETDDGHRVEWRRRGTVVSYILDGKEVHRLRGDIPDELHGLLRLPKVHASDNREPYDIHFGLQKAPIFLLNEPGSRAATFFASSSDAAKLIEMQTRHREKARQASQDERRSSEQADRVQRQIANLSPVDDLQNRIGQVERDYESLLSVCDQLESMKGIREELFQHLQTTERWLAEVASLINLRNPPSLDDTSPLAGLIDGTVAITRSESLERDRAESLATLGAPPQLSDTTTLDTLTSGIAIAQRRHARCEAVRDAAVGLAVPPQLGDAEALANTCRIVGRLQKAIDRLTAQESCLLSLVRVPAIHDVPKLDDLIQQLSASGQQVEFTREKSLTLDKVSKLPVVYETHSLTETIGLVLKLQAQCQARRMVKEVFERIEAVPVEVDSSPLEEMISELKESLGDIESHQKTVDAAKAELSDAEKALRRWAKENQICPTCGGTTDADRLIDSAASGMGGHAHG